MAWENINSDLPKHVPRISISFSSNRDWTGHLILVLASSMKVNGAVGMQRMSGVGIVTIGYDKKQIWALLETKHVGTKRLILMFTTSNPFELW